jgi:23S rRNA pseudouridine1911/1915/1917 synthase
VTDSAGPAGPGGAAEPAHASTDDGPAHARFTLQRDLRKRLDKYLGDRIPWLSRTSLQRLIAESAVTVNGRAPKASTKLRKGDVVDVILPPTPSSDLPAEDIPIAILHEDDDLLIVDKHDDIIVHPARGNQSGTLINGLAWHLRQTGGGSLSGVGADQARPGVVHRLDRHTTGVMVVAKNETAHWRLGKQFEQRRTRKRYLALVHGTVEPTTDVIDLPLGKHPTIKHRNAVRWDDTGKQAVTLYRVLESYGDFSLVEVELRTGRTHQIRVHLSHLGWPIAGDDLYGGRHIEVRDILPPDQSEGDRRRPLLQRQALHAAMLGFTHPTTEKDVEFQAMLPQDMAELIGLLRSRGPVHRPATTGTVLNVDALLPPHGAVE